MQDQVQMSETRPAKIRDGCVWYAALLPAFALLLERYALNKYLGILVWAIALLMRPVCCFLDRKQLIAAGRPEEDPYLPLLPTVYLFKTFPILLLSLLSKFISLLFSLSTKFSNIFEFPKFFLCFR